MHKGDQETIWQMSAVKNIDKKIANILPKIDPCILKLLLTRGIKNISSFLEPDFIKGQHNPNLLVDMKKAKERIIRAAKQDEKILIFGHYDCDGVCAAALLKETFDFINIRSKVHIPSREEGYQINKKLFDDFKKQGFSLIVTVDFGITDEKAALMAKKYDIDLIICDHHQPPKKLPKAYAIINPQISPKYPFKDLSGTGVVYKLVSVLVDNEGFLKWSQDLVALATVADVVPLVDENRIFVKYGLLVLKKTRRPGLNLLLQKAEIRPEKINTYSIGFQIAPRLNASGRMGNASDSYQLLVSKDPLECEKISTKLCRLNSERQQVLDKCLKQALKKVRQNGLCEKKLIIVSDKNWAEGILGLIAGKLTEIFTRPVIALKEDGDFFRGSARSIEEFHITDALRQFEDILEKVGGHKKAAGLTIKTELMKDLYDKLTNFADTNISKKSLAPKIKIDLPLKLDSLTDYFWKSLELLEPYGYGNPKPSFMTKNLKVVDIRQIGGDGKHIALNITDGKKLIRGVGFEMGPIYSKIKAGDRVDLAYNLDMNEWNGNKNLEMHLIDIKIKD